MSHHIPNIERASPFSPLLIWVSIGCFCLSCYFESQYEQAYGAHLARPLIGLASPETYKNRDETVLFADILVCILAMVLAVRHKSWLDWLAVAFTAVTCFAILLNLLARL